MLMHTYYFLFILTLVPFCVKKSFSFHFINSENLFYGHTFHVLTTQGDFAVDHAMVRAWWC